MFDFGFSELLLIGAIALVVLGPERLPKAARMAGSLLGRAQNLIGGIKQELNAQIQMDELRQAKQEFESAAGSLKNEINHIGAETQSHLNEISDGLKVPAWERVPEMRTPADFGLDENGHPLPDFTHNNGETESSFFDAGYAAPTVGSRSFNTASIHKQAIQRKRDMRPRYRPKPHLRARRK
ncbi:Sec-independent protein translocase protein TatB [Neisseria weaveri]|uniref:Sec-independent protein translocase protein TatB n=1 Tax=Neisseria weaveri TaxID=28091 RepID=UPI0002231730|nr:Sec-independent protein translocase protein TatB [Neisseria weaveri]EGV35014.1 hypothetical protein l13_18750 [Neisseria weaveri ATCC 51223]